MLRPTVLQPGPSLSLTILGGLVATLLVSALIYAAPSLGLPLLDLPLLVGGVFSAEQSVALWLGYWLFFLSGLLLPPILLHLIWQRLPGHALRFRGALLKGLLLGVAFWIASGLIVALLGFLNQLSAQELTRPGLFGLGMGIMGAAWLLALHLAYGLSLALIAAMGRGIVPIDTLGWVGHSNGTVRDVAIGPEGKRQAEGMLGSTSAE